MEFRRTVDVIEFCRGVDFVDFSSMEIVNVWHFGSKILLSLIVVL